MRATSSLLPPRDPPLRAPSLPRILLAVVPALVMGAVVVSTIWGDKGLIARHQLQRELAEEQAELAAIERENQRLKRKLSLMERDPRVVERILADELRWAHPDAVIYDFSEHEQQDHQREPAGR